MEKNDDLLDGSDDAEMNALLVRLGIAVAKIKQIEEDEKKPRGKPAPRGSAIHRGDGFDSVRDFIADNLKSSVGLHLGIA